MSKELNDDVIQAAELEDTEKLNDSGDANVVDQVTLTGRAGFAINTVASGVSVQTVFVTEDQKVHALPAVFPNLPYALEQIDQLRNHVINHFSQAAAIGSQVIAHQSEQASKQLQ